MNDATPPQETKRRQFTDKFIQKLKPGDRTVEFTDTLARGLRLKVTPSGTKTFFLKARDHESRLRTVTLGRYREISLQEARRLASVKYQELKDGVVPNARSATGAPSNTPRASLLDILIEYEKAFAATRVSWRPKGGGAKRSHARQVIENVFRDLIAVPVEQISLSDLSHAMNSYKPIRDKEKTSSSGQVSRARAYLSPVLNWTANRKNFSRVGAGRPTILNVVDVSQTHDPAKSDPSISGERDRVLTEAELRAILPLLRYPAPGSLKMKLEPALDYRPIALRFMLYTASRRSEVTNMRKRDIDFDSMVWNKSSIKSTTGRKRTQSLPLPEEVIRIIMNLPSLASEDPDSLIFPNAHGNPLDNWIRIQNSIFRESGTADWHRHDLRRSAATLMRALQVPVSTIDQILGHTDPLRRENLSGSASTYLRSARILENYEDPQVAALRKLARCLESFEINN